MKEAERPAWLRRILWWIPTLLILGLCVPLVLGALTVRWTQQVPVLDIELDLGRSPLWSPPRPVETLEEATRMQGGYGRSPRAESAPRLGSHATVRTEPEWHFDLDSEPLFRLWVTPFLLGLILLWRRIRKLLQARAYERMLEPPDPTPEVF